MLLRRVAPILVVCLLSLAAAQQSAPQPLETSSDLTRGLLVRRVAPAYPPLARQARIQGTVMLRVVITKAGDVSNIHVVSGHPMLAPAAIEAVKQWKYQPFQQNGEPVDVETNVEVKFTLADNPPAGIAGDVPGGAPPGTVGSIQRGIVTNEPNPATAKRIRVSSGVSQGLLEHKVNPTYPAEAREQGIQGTVLMKVNIDTSGNVYAVELISGPPELAPAAMDAVRQWKYKPYLLNGTPVEVETQVLINFTLSGR